MSGDEFDWWFDGNPAGSLRSVAVMDDRVVGVAAHSLYAMVLDGELQTASFSVHATTDEVGARAWDLRRAGAKARARGAGAGRRVRARLRERADDPALPRPARLDADRGAADLGSAGARRALLAKRHRVSTSTATRLRTWPNHVVRSAEYLQWRYLDSPRGYEAVVGRRRVRRRLAGEGASRPDDLRRRRPDEHVDAGRGQAARAGALAVRAAGARAAARVPRRGLPARRRRSSTSWARRSPAG